MDWTVISAVNDDEVLKSSLLDSPGIKSASQVILQRGFRSAALAYNDAINKAKTDLLVFVHQDMYLPEGWIESVERAVETLASQDPNWGVLGVWGAQVSGDRVGYLYWTGDMGLERPFDGVKEVRTLDEVVLIFRKSSGLKFDVQLPSYHFYGTDICLEAARKWMKSLPVDTPCTRLVFSCRPILEWHVFYFRDRLMGRRKPLVRAAAPRELDRDLLARNRVRQPAPKPSQSPTQTLAKAS